jgi:hypothetical protein
MISNVMDGPGVAMMNKEARINEIQRVNVIWYPRFLQRIEYLMHMNYEDIRLQTCVSCYRQKKPLKPTKEYFHRLNGVLLDLKNCLRSRSVTGYSRGYFYQLNIRKGGEGYLPPVQGIQQRKKLVGHGLKNRGGKTHRYTQGGYSKGK